MILLTNNSNTIKIFWSLPNRIFLARYTFDFKAVELFFKSLVLGFIPKKSVFFYAQRTTIDALENSSIHCVFIALAFFVRV